MASATVVFGADKGGVRPNTNAKTRAASRHDLNHQLVISRTNSRFPEVPTVRLGGFLYLQEGLFNAGCFFFFVGRGHLADVD